MTRYFSTAASIAAAALLFLLAAGPSHALANGGHDGGGTGESSGSRGNDARNGPAVSNGHEASSSVSDHESASQGGSNQFASDTVQTEQSDSETQVSRTAKRSQEVQQQVEETTHQNQHVAAQAQQPQLPQSNPGPAALVEQVAPVSISPMPGTLGVTASSLPATGQYDVSGGGPDTSSWAIAGALGLMGAAAMLALVGLRMRRR